MNEYQIIIWKMESNNMSEVEKEQKEEQEKGEKESWYYLDRLCSCYRLTSPRFQQLYNSNPIVVYLEYLRKDQKMECKVKRMGEQLM